MVNEIRREMVELLPRLRRFAYSLTGTLDDADDLVQASCERALKRLDQFVPGTRLDSWMFRIVQTLWIDRLRQSKRRNEMPVGDDMEQIPSDDRIVERIEARSALEIVRNEFGQLPEDQRVVLSLIVVDGRSYQEAAEILEIPIGTVMSRLSRARRKLALAIASPPANSRVVRQ